MPSGGPVGTTLKLDYWDERWRTGTLFPTYTKCFNTLICCPLAYISSLAQLYPHYLAQILGFWVPCGVKMMSYSHGWGWRPPQTAFHILIRHIKSWVESTLICCPLYSSSPKQLYPPYLAQILGFWVTCGVKMMSLHHGWGWQPHQPSSNILLHIYNVFEHIDMLSIGIHQQPYTVYPPYLAQILGFRVTRGVKMMSLHHGWGWQPLQIDSHIHLIHIQSVWAHWYAVHQHRVGAFHSYPPYFRLRFWGSVSLVESKWCRYVMVHTSSHLKLLPTSILHIFKVFENINMLSIVIQQQHYTVLPTLLGSKFEVLDHLWSQNYVNISWLRLPATSNCFQHPY